MIEHLTNKNAIVNSKQFPFRFYSALKAIEGYSDGDPFSKQKLIDALNKALDISVECMPKLRGRIYVKKPLKPSKDLIRGKTIFTYILH